MPPGVAGLGEPVEIGRGGFGVVYRARDERFDRDVALKVIRDAGLSDEVLARFARECRSLGALSGHPNIVSIHDAGQTADGELYLVMEYLPGGSLAERTAADGPAEPRDVVAWGAALAGALETAHRSGIVHRDVKPENVLFSTFGAPKLVDFGIARMRTAFETRSGSVSATLGHAAPEIIGGAPASPRSDVYSLASVLFFALTGQAPFDRPDEESLAPLIARIATAPPPDLREFGVPGALADVVAAALAKDPEDRPATAAEFGAALQGVAGALGAAVPPVPVEDVATIGPLFERPPGERPTPRLDTVHVARRREPLPAPAGERPRRRNRLASVLVALLGVVAVAGAALGIAAPWRDDAAEQPELRLAESVVDTAQGLQVHREYGYSDDLSEVVSTVRLVNTSDAGVRVSWIEPIPEELAPSLDDVEFSVDPHSELADQLLACWVFDLAPDGTQPLTWSVPVPEDVEPSREHLEEVRDQVAEATVATQEAADLKRLELAEEEGAAPAEAPPTGTDTGTGTGTGADAGTPPQADGGTTVLPGTGSAPAVPGATGGGGTTGSTTGGTGGTGGGGTVPVPVPAGGGGSAPQAAPAPPADQGGAPAPAPANRAPVVSASDVTSNELQSPGVTFGGSDPDGGAVTVAVSGLPPGLAHANGRITGTVSASAAAVTTTRGAIQARGFPVTVTVTDAAGASTSRTVTWTVRDTHTTMPNYVNTYGCGRGCGENGNPDVADISAPGFFCTVGSPPDTIAAQSVGPGTVIAWGQSVTYTYRQASC
ncbi:protein kinase domain-containing protein [Blastococcus sp. SYSU D00813]